MKRFALGIIAISAISAAALLAGCGSDTPFSPRGNLSPTGNTGNATQIGTIPSVRSQASTAATAPGN